MYALVFVYCGVISHVKMSPNLEELKAYVVEVVTHFDPSEDSIQIWDENYTVVFSYEFNVLGLS